MIRWLLTLPLLNTPLIGLAAALAAVLIPVVVMLRPQHLWRLLAAFLTGLVGGYILAHALESAGLFDGPLPLHAAVWAAFGIGVAAIGITAAFSRPWWRRLLAVVMALAALLAGALGVNQSYGVTPTLAAILGIQALDGADLPALSADDGDPATLYERWSPPADMPAQGTVSALTGDTRIPSGDFAARDAAIYLPPAALVANPPRLPLIVFMMGQPGTPEPSSLAKALDAFASTHDGLAPIAIVADQLGAPTKDPSCHDSATFGAVETYFTSAIPAFAKAKLNVVTDHAYWTIGGFSNGGACAFAWGAQHPDVWGNMIDISGNEFPGSEHIDPTVRDVFGGDREAFEAAKPSAVLAANPGAYDGHVAIFTLGGADETFGPGQLSNAKLADAAGFTVYTNTIPGAGHTGDALSGGLTFAIATLATHLGLAAPSG